MTEERRQHGRALLREMFQCTLDDDWLDREETAAVELEENYDFTQEEAEELIASKWWEQP